MFNPEFRRYVWLELTRHRLIAVPALLAVIGVVVVAAAPHPSEFFIYSGLGIFAALTGIYGSVRAFGSVTDELRDRTWDFQRMSALSPWSLALGKVAGAPVFAWYAGAWALGVFLLGALTSPEGFAYLTATFVGSVAGCVMAHAMGVSMSAATARLGLGAKGRRAGGLLSALALMYVLSTLSVLLFAGRRGDSGGKPYIVKLFGAIDLSLPAWGALTLVLLSAWALVSAWRMMARELREPPIWSIWVVFAGFLALWMAGTAFEGQASLPTIVALGCGIIVLTLAAYIGLMLDPLTGVARTRFARLRQASPPAAWDKKLPQWVIHGGIALVLALVAVAITGMPPSMAELAATGNKAANTTQVTGLLARTFPLATVLPLVLMFIRDAAIVTCFTLARSQKRPVATAVFYIALLNFLLPLLFAALQLTPLAYASMPFAGLPYAVWFPAAGFAVHALMALVVLWALHGRSAKS